LQEHFVAVDGDNVGSHLEYFAITNNVDALMGFSTKFNMAMDWLVGELINGFKARIIFMGGDNLLAKVLINQSGLELLEQLRNEFAKQAESTLSMGIGETPQQAYLALKLAKTGGKNVIKQYKELSNG